MIQSRTMSAVEACANVLIGWLAALSLQMLLFPLVGVTAGLDQHVIISLVFTAVSLLRSYVLRRAFARLA